MSGPDLIGGIPAGWRLARFDEFLRRVERRIVLDDSESYNCVGVRWYGMGAFVRERLTGAEITRKQQWLVKQGDVLYNKLFAWKGSFAVADDSVDGCIGSDKFPTYEVDRAQIDPRYLRCYFLTPQLAKQARDLSRGAAAISKFTLNPPQFWDLTIPLPPPAEQERLLARIDLVATRLNELRSLRCDAANEATALFQSAASAALGRLPITGTLGEILLDEPHNGWSTKCDNADDGTPVLTLSAVTGFHYSPVAFKRTSASTSPLSHYWLHAGDLLISRSNTLELVGHAAIYDGNPSPCIYPDLMMRLAVDSQVADTRFVWMWLQTSAVRDYITLRAKGTSATMKKISQGVVMGIPFPLGIPLPVQRRIVAELAALEPGLDALKRLQAESAAELDGLLPSILDRAFKGEL